MTEGRRGSGLEAEWTPASLAAHIQAVLPGAFILAKATGDGQVAHNRVDHLARYLELLFQPGRSGSAGERDRTEHAQ